MGDGVQGGSGAGTSSETHQSNAHAPSDASLTSDKESLMVRFQLSHRAILLGLAVLAVGIAAALWSNQPVQAVGATQNDKLLQASGPLDDSGGATFILDALTGDLKGFRVSAVNGKFNFSFYRNIAADFGLERVKGTPKFTMVIERETFVRRGQNKIAPMVIYIAEATTGKIAAYGVPWNAGLRNRILDVSKPAPIILLDGLTFRGNIIRDAASD